MRIHLLFLVALLLGACNPRLIPEPQPVPARGSGILTPDPQANRLISLAVADLSARLSLPPDQIQLVSIESFLWPDAALGCSSPGEQPARTVVRGYEIYLEAAGGQYVYHTDEANTVRLCSTESSPSFPVTPDDLQDGSPWMPVD